jgi:hypothetical protein
MAGKRNRDHRLDNDEDFVQAKRFRNSLSKFLENNDKGLDFKGIGRMLRISSEEAEQIYARAIRKLNRMLK